MDEGTKARWVKASAAILAAMQAQDGRPPDPDKARADLRNQVRRIESLLDASGGSWDDAVRQDLTERIFNVVPTEELRLLATFGSRRLVALRHGWAVATGDLSDVPEADRGVLHRMLRDVPGLGDLDAFLAPVAPPPEPPVGQGPVPVRFRFVRTVAPQQKMIVDGYGEAVLAPLDAASAPVVMRLRSVHGDVLALRRMADGTLLRPVLSPGSREPATVGRFLRAAEEGGPWADDPYRPPVRGDRAAVMPMALVVHRPPTRRRDADALDAAEAEAWSERAGPLHVVDGVVHRTCGMPVLVERVLPDGDAFVVRLGWAFPDGLDSHSTESHLLAHAHPALGLRAEAGRSAPFRFGAHEADMAREALTRAVRWRNQAASARDSRRTASVPDLVEVLRPEAFAADTDSLLRYLAAWRASKVPFDDADPAPASEAVAALLDEGARPTPDALDDLADAVGRKVDRYYRGSVALDDLVAFRSLLVQAARMVERDARIERDLVDEDVAGLTL